jgi:hypothetical protein
LISASCPIIITPSSTPFTPNANPQDPAPNNVIGTPGSKAEEDLIVGLVVGIGGAAIIAAVLLAVLLSRRFVLTRTYLLHTNNKGDAEIRRKSNPCLPRLKEAWLE